MKRLLTTLVIVMLAVGCTSSPVVSPDISELPESVLQRPETPASRPENDLTGQHGGDILAGMTLRDLVADRAGQRFIVQDERMSLFLVGESAGMTKLGEAPEIGLLAAWGENDYGFAFARKSATDASYEIVGVGHEGSRVLPEDGLYPACRRRCQCVITRRALGV